MKSTFPTLLTFNREIDDIASFGRFHGLVTSDLELSRARSRRDEVEMTCHTTNIGTTIDFCNPSWLKLQPAGTGIRCELARLRRSTMRGIRGFDPWGDR